MRLSPFFVLSFLLFSPTSCFYSFTFFVCLRGSRSVSVCVCVYFFALLSVSLSVSPSFLPPQSVFFFSSLSLHIIFLSYVGFLYRLVYPSALRLLSPFLPLSVPPPSIQLRSHSMLFLKVINIYFSSPSLLLLQCTSFKCFSSHSLSCLFSLSCLCSLNFTVSSPSSRSLPLFLRSPNFSLPSSGCLASPSPL